MLYQTKNPHGGDVYGEEILLDFSANTNPLGTPPGVLATVEESLAQLHRYPDPYCRRLVRAIAEFEQVPENWILCGNGAAELIYAYCASIGAKQAVELAPTFSEYSLALEQAGCAVSRYTLTRERGFVLDEGFLEFLDREKPEVVFLCNPNNPTGRTVPKALLLDILRYCRERGIRLFVDECFADLSDRQESLKEELADNSHVFLLKAFTKSYGMAGLRLGYCLTSDGELLGKMAKAVQPWNVSTPAQAAGTAALGEQAFLEKTRALIAVERAWLKEELEKLGLWVCPSEVNYLLFRGPEDLGQNLKRRKIALRSCANYFGLGPGWYRTAVRRHEENEALVQALREELERSGHG